MSGTGGSSLSMATISVLWILAAASCWCPAAARAVRDDYDVKDLPMRSASQCFHVPGVPVVNLRCKSDQLIRVNRAFYGVIPEQDDGRHPCAYDARITDGCVQDMTLKENCMGRSVCTLAVSNPFLNNCEQYATYMQVNYTCVPRVRVRDMCEEAEVTAWRGYLSSPNYPASYGPNARCQCSLKTHDSSILLHILDFALNVTRGRKKGICQEDMLRIAGWGDKCNPVVPEGLPETLGLREQAVTLSFRSDAKRQSRGFWLEFIGSNGGKVTVSCGKRPLDVKPNKLDSKAATARDDGETRLKASSTSNIQSTLEEAVLHTNDIDDDHNEGLGDEYEDIEETTDNNIVLVDDGGYRPRRPLEEEAEGEEDNEVDDVGNEFSTNDFASMDNNEFDTYDFTDQAEYHLYNVGDVQLATGIVVSVLILIAVVIIIVLVFRR